MCSSVVPTTLFVLTGGGFTFENRCLLHSLASDVRPVYLATVHGGRPGEPGIPPGPVYEVPSFASISRPSLRQSVVAFVSTFLTTLRVIRRERIPLVIGIGCSHSVAMIVAGRLSGCRTVFIESIARTDRLSRTGALIYYLRLAQITLVQWPNLKALYPRAVLGTVL